MPAFRQILIRLLQVYEVECLLRQHDTQAALVGRGTYLVDNRLNAAVLESGRHDLQFFSVANEDSSNIGGTVQNRLGKIYGIRPVSAQVTYLHPGYAVG